MTYLIMHMWFCLIIAFLLGAVLGYLLCKIFCKNKVNIRTVETVDALLDDEAFDDIPDMPPGLTANIAAYDPQDLVFIEELDTDINLDNEKDYGIQTLEGIGPRTGDLFRSIGVSTVGDYIRRLHSPALRRKAAEDLGIKIDPLHEWASMSDLLRIEGIDHQFSELMHASGILTVADLANSGANLLVTKMESVNNAGPQLISPSVPTADQLKSWIKRAKTMTAAVSV
jgi:exopolysaccharide biosynthesis protein